MLHLPPHTCPPPPQEAEGHADAAMSSRLSDLLSRCGAMVTVRPKPTFSIKHLETDLGKLLKVRRRGEGGRGWWRARVCVRYVCMWDCGSGEGPGLRVTA